MMPGVSRKFRFFFERGDESLDPKMYMRRPASEEGDALASRLKAATIMGRGSSSYVRGRGSSSQRVTVKTKVVQGAAKAKDHARYLEKEAAGLDGTEVHGFTATKDDVDLQELTTAWSEDRHYFQTIISPEHGDRLAMQQYVRDVMARYEQDLGTKLSWGSVIHYDTEHPHAHVMIRGRDDRGGDLVIDREYIRHGMRTRAMEVATQELGPRPAHEIVAAMERRQRDLAAGIGQAQGLGKAAGWQLHLAVPAERWHPTTQAVMTDLSERGLSYQMKFGTKDTKVLTVSVGGYDDAVRVARELDGKFGHQILDQAGKIARDDVRLSGHVWGAFDTQGDKQFTRWTVKGLPLEKESAKDLRGLEGPAREALRDTLRTAADAKLMERYGAFYAGTERVQALEKLQELQRNMGHGY
jgi:hypothetical protein